MTARGRESARADAARRHDPVSAAQRRVGDWSAFYGQQARLMWQWRATRLALARRLVLNIVATAIALAIVAWLSPGIAIAGPAPIIEAAVALTLGNAVLRPVLLLVLSPMPVLTVQVAGTIAEIVLVAIVARAVPGIAVDGPVNAVVAGVALSLLIALLSEILRASDDDSYHGTQVRRLAAREFGRRAPREPGLLMVQLDGLALPILETQMRAGRMPALAGLVRSGSHVVDPWHPLLPPVTPASQAGFLHGDNDDVPGFRWYDKHEHRLVVANTPEGAEVVERLVSNGDGLLAQDGASIGNLVSGDAARSYFTMATLTGDDASKADPRRLHGVFITQVNYIRLIVLAVGELLKDLYQRERQRSRAVEPRIRRNLHAALERVLTNVPLRHLTTALVIEEVFSGAPAIYVDYTGYDTLAHHVGPERVEAIDALDGLDRTLGSILRACREAPRPYRLVVLSDHGQCLGETFVDRFSVPLEDRVRALMGEDATSASTRAMPRETEGTGRRILGELSRGPGVRPAIARRAIRAGRRTDRAIDHPSVVVCPSGSLAHLYFTFTEGRATLEEIEQRYPDLVPGLLRLPGVAVVLARTAADGPVAFGPDGRHELVSGHVVGTDPLLGFGPLAVSSLVRLDGFANCGDLTLLGAYDAQRSEVLSFEDLVGSHGGLGGWQVRPFLLHPADLEIGEKPLIGAVAVHDQLQAWIEQLSGRAATQAHPAPAEGDAAKEDASGAA